MCRSFGRHEEVSLRTVARRMPQYLFEIAEKRDRVQRHPDTDIGGKLRPHAAHALSGGTFSLVTLALKNEHVAAARLGELISDARSNDTASDDDYFRR